MCPNKKKLVALTMPQGEVKTKVYMLENTLPFILGRRI
jgi:hypothetical protein